MSSFQTDKDLLHYHAKFVEKIRDDLYKIRLEKPIVCNEWSRKYDCNPRMDNVAIKKGAINKKDSWEVQKKLFADQKLHLLKQWDNFELKEKAFIFMVHEINVYHLANGVKRKRAQANLTKTKQNLSEKQHQIDHLKKKYQYFLEVGDKLNENTKKLAMFENYFKEVAVNHLAVDKRPINLIKYYENMCLLRQNNNASNMKLVNELIELKRNAVVFTYNCHIALIALKSQFAIINERITRNREKMTELVELIISICTNSIERQCELIRVKNAIDYMYELINDRMNTFMETYDSMEQLLYIKSHMGVTKKLTHVVKKQSEANLLHY